MARWAEDKLERNGWISLGLNENIAYYWRVAKPIDGPNKVIWVRFEFPKAATSGRFSYLSTASLEEFDCKGRSRPLSLSLYSGQNLSGVANGGQSLREDWDFVQPGTVEDSLEHQACSGARAHKHSRRKP